MKVLWTVNSLAPEIAKAVGQRSAHATSWIDAMSHQLAKNVEIQLAIAYTGRCSSIEKHIIDNVTYYIIPNKLKDNDYYGIIIDEFKPDVIHAYGTEFPHNFYLVSRHKEVPVIISLQGIATEYARHTYAGVDFSTMLRFTSIKDLFRPTGFFSSKKNYERSSILEKEILRNVNYVEGRSTWDRVSSLNINPKLKYYYCPRLIRAPFYENRWDVKTMTRHTVFVHQGNTLVKGTHFVLQAVAKLKDKYPDIKLLIAGRDPLSYSNIKQKLFKSGYQKYIKYLIDSLALKDHIEYTGILNAKQMAELLTKVNVTVVSSSIENAPNSLAEAMIVGTPTVATFVGGNMDMMVHKKEGFLYCYNEPNMLAEYISQLFDNDDLAIGFSNAAVETARKRHNPELLENKLIGIYEDVISHKN